MTQAATSTTSPLSPLHRLVFNLQHQLNELLLEQYGVGFAQVRILGELNKSVPSSQKEIANRLGQSEANISRQLGLMHKQRLVSITKSQGDSRKKEVLLSIKGARLTAKALKLLGKEHDKLLNSLNRSDSKTFVRSTEKLADNTSKILT